MSSDLIEPTVTYKPNKSCKDKQQYEKGIIIVWLDISSEIISQATKTVEQLQEITKDVKVFADSNVCVDYINHLKGQRIFFIMSDPVDQCVLTFTQDLLTVSALYILYSPKEDTKEKWIESIRKVRGVYTDINRLLEQIEYDLRLIEYDFAGFEMLSQSEISSPSSKNLNKQEYSFMYSQLLKDVFLKFQDNSIPEMAQHCRTVYQNNLRQHDLINEFERNYKTTDAILWYTREPFVYKEVNKALRNQSVKALYSMRTYIRHLHQKLVELHSIDEKPQSATRLTFYRGQQMPIEEFEKIKKNEGGLLSISSFLSTSTSRLVASIYVGDSDDKTAAVLFELTVDVNDKSNSSFARIEEYSQYGQGEQEWLFSISTVFRIGKIELIDKIWHVSLALTHDHDEILENLTIHMSKIIQMQHHNPLIPLCRLFARMDEYEEVAELCKQYISSENGWEMEATLYDTLALMYMNEERRNSALSCHKRALSVVAKHVDKNDPLLSSYHNNLAISYEAVNQDELALQHYRIVIDLEPRASLPDYTTIAYSYDSMGSILHYSFRKYDEALRCYERALELMLVHLPSAYSDIFSLYTEMANIYEEQNRLDEALDMLSKCRNAQRSYLECDPFDLAKTERSIAEIYKKSRKSS